MLADVCEECTQARQTSEFEVQMNYTEAKIYVRKISSDEEKDVKKDAKLDSIQVCLIKTNYFMMCIELRSYEYLLMYSLQDNGGEPADKMARIDVRRSSRRRLPRGTKEIDITPTMTLRDLKKKV